MAREPKRRCGYRKVGGLYMVSGKLSAPCGRLPLELHVCPVCNAGVKQTRAWQWIKPGPLLANAPLCSMIAFETLSQSTCGDCPLSVSNLAKLERAGLLWIGERFYPTPKDFMGEARELGVSRRIPAIPRNFKLGETWVLIAHPKAVELSPADPRVTEEERQELYLANVKRAEAGEPQRFAIERGGIITMFKPRAIEKIVTESQSKDAEAMKVLAEKGITPVVVPDDDKDHQGDVYALEPEKDDRQVDIEEAIEAAVDVHVQEALAGTIPDGDLRDV